MAVMQFFHGELEDGVARAIKSVRLVLMLGAEGEDVEVLNANENIAKEEHKRHCELDNIVVAQQWMESMKSAE
eukprot:3206658-Lingulodinium_polyedra.AAC.1